MSEIQHGPLLKRLIDGDLSYRAVAGLLRAMDDPATVEWREEGNTLCVDIYKDRPRGEIFDLLDCPDAPPEVLDLEDLRRRLLTVRGPQPSSR
jgi:hypothetical protein